MLGRHSIRTSTILLVLATLVASPVRAAHSTAGEKCVVAKLKVAFKKMAKKAVVTEQANTRRTSGMGGFDQLSRTPVRGPYRHPEDQILAASTRSG